MKKKHRKRGSKSGHWKKQTRKEKLSGSHHYRSTPVNKSTNELFSFRSNKKATLECLTDPLLADLTEIGHCQNGLQKKKGEGFNG